MLTGLKANETYKTVQGMGMYDAQGNLCMFVPAGAVNTSVQATDTPPADTQVSKIVTDFLGVWDKNPSDQVTRALIKCNSIAKLAHELGQESRAGMDNALRRLARGNETPGAVFQKIKNEVDRSQPLYRV